MYKKHDGQTFCEFDRGKEAIFHSFCQSTNFNNIEDLQDFILEEEFKNCLPDKICDYINEQKVETVATTRIWVT